MKINDVNYESLFDNNLISSNLIKAKYPSSFANMSHYYISALILVLIFTLAF